MGFFLLALLWILWCSLHSFMISGRVVSAVRRRFGDRYRYYRLLFNMVSVLTLFPVLLYSQTLRGDVLFPWTGVWRPVQLLLIVSSLALFYSGARHYDLKQFIGIRQIREHETKKGLTESGELDTSGILGVVRHPWYSGGILIIWARPLDSAALVTNLVLTFYLIIGTLLEEKKLVTEFGQAYRDYQKKVPMFVPARRRQNERDHR